MNSEFKKDLNQAHELKRVGKYSESLAIFNKLYQDNPEDFTINQKFDYAWTIYKTHIQFPKNKEDLFKNGKIITEMVQQRDLNINRNCVYTSTIFAILKYLKEQQDFYEMITWIEKLNPELLDENPYRKYGRINKSKKEKFYDFASKAYLESMEFEKCIEISKTALITFKRFLDDGDVWHKWRIAKSLNELNRLDEALEYYLEVIEVKHEWYMYRDIAEVYYRLNKHYIALDYLCPAVLSNAPNSVKVNLYYLCFKVFMKFNPKMALKHAQLVQILKKEKNYQIPYEIEKLGIDDEKINKKNLEREIKNLWIQYKNKNKKLHHGTVIKFINDKNYGFIKDEDDNSLFFHKNEFKGSNIFVGQLVSFYTEESFDKVKNKKSLKAVNVRGD